MWSCNHVINGNTHIYQDLINAYQDWYRDYNRVAVIQSNDHASFTEITLSFYRWIHLCHAMWTNNLVFVCFPYHQVNSQMRCWVNMDDGCTCATFEQCNTRQSSHSQGYVSHTITALILRSHKSKKVVLLHNWLFASFWNVAGVLRCLRNLSSFTNISRWRHTAF